MNVYAENWPSIGRDAAGMLENWHTDLAHKTKHRSEILINVERETGLEPATSSLEG